MIVARKDGWIGKKLAIESLGGKCSRCEYMAIML